MRSQKPTHRGPRDERGVVAARILSVARASFAAHGYAGTSLRSVGRDADVDPGLVIYYFKDKRGLLDAALVPHPAGPRRSLPRPRLRCGFAAPRWYER